MRSSCNNCRTKRITCSRLYTTASKCTACQDLNLECDCKVLRTACEFCERMKLRCYGNEDNYGNCIRLHRECKPFEQENFTDPIPEEAQFTPATAIPKNADAEGLLDVVDGMKMNRFTFGCNNCEENPMLRCDKGVNGCAYCRNKKQPCVYPSVVNPLYAPLHGQQPISKL